MEFFFHILLILSPLAAKDPAPAPQQHRHLAPQRLPGQQLHQKAVQEGEEGGEEAGEAATARRAATGRECGREAIHR